ncbi:hypothetical protein GCM10007385_40770 [Tateyamaria omphalii]|uniref:hypothetical protein n=1 Tax=Tateyamaria omphalii TaxID=299262 RepID=UPI001671AC76|nr:hypothetical protein [Tateyamaria omphalii]GGX67481.1 hypothetical protein GCM10007385_40770 [Tateyamaria omphalii]
MSPLSIYLPVLAGHAFQQTALIGMVPLLALALGLHESEIGLAVAMGLVTAGVALPFVSLLGGRIVVLGGLGGLLLANLVLLYVVGTGVQGWSTTFVFVLLAVIRSVQGVSAAGLMMAAQTQGVAQENSLKGLGIVQSMGSVGRIFSAALIGPLLLVSQLAPLLPAALGAMVSLMMNHGKPAPKLRATMRPPRLTAFRVTVLTQVAVGAAQIGLAPVILDQLEAEPMRAAGNAGFCLAAANLGLFLALRLLAHRTGQIGARLAGLLLVLAAACVPFADRLATFLFLSFVIGGSTGLLFTLNLSEIMTREDYAQLQVTGWNGAIQIAALAGGVASGSALLALSPAAPFAIVALSGAALAFAPPSTQRT